MQFLWVTLILQGFAIGYGIYLMRWVRLPFGRFAAFISLIALTQFVRRAFVILEADPVVTNVIIPAIVTGWLVLAQASFHLTILKITRGNPRMLRYIRNFSNDIFNYDELDQAHIERLREIEEKLNVR